MSIEVRPARLCDVAEVVRVHRAGFPGFFLTSLGPRFLVAFYSGLVRLDLGILFVALRGTAVVGFVGGSPDQASFYRALLRRRGPQLALAALPALLRRPASTARLLRGRERLHDDEAAAVPACLMSLAVDPALHAHGYGRALVQAFEHELRSRGSAGYVLTTDADGNDATNAFYRSLGLVRTRTVVTREGRRLHEYARQWTDQEAIS
ncbi:GNAT family N-acetyltransferase [Mumia quercus]|uniref:GNAT family N-acetyltransferase n=1 Tax=Mumia quercus TaxID=2976125 RepID=UPI0021D15D30|nr:GNAT family N-acetyltransferase [Mumia quercus]